MSIPTYQDLFLVVLKTMSSRKLFKRKDIHSLLEPLILKEYKVSTQDNVVMGNGLTKICDRLGWAMTFLTKAEYIEKDITESFSYKITDLGLNALEDVTKNNKILNEKYLKENSVNYLKNWSVNIADAKSNDSENQSLEEEFNLENAIDEIKQDTEAKFITTLRSMDWFYFEDFCAKLVEKMGYGVAAKRIIRVKDGGIDGTIYNDELGLKDKIYIQAKRYNEDNTVSSKDLQAFLHILSKQKAKGIFITTSKFSKEALSVADDDKKSGNISLIDYKELIRLASKYKCGFRVKTTVEILEVDL
jgi:restriction system protein